MREFVFVGIFSLLLSSCNTQDDNCNGSKTPSSSQYDIVGMIADGVKAVEPLEVQSVPLLFNSLAAEESVGIDEFILELRATTGPAFAKNTRTDTFDYSFSIFPKAHACSPAPPFTNEKIELMTITSTSDFSEEYPSGTDLKVLFSVIYNETNLYDTSGENLVAYRLDEYVALKPNAGALMQLVLNDTPAVSKSHQFYIEYSHTDGEFFTMSTQEVEFE